MYMLYYILAMNISHNVFVKISLHFVYSFINWVSVSLAVYDSLIDPDCETAAKFQNKR